MAKNYDIVGVLSNQKTFTRVFLGQSKQSLENVAIKVVDFEKDSQYSNKRETDRLCLLTNELIRIRKLNHPNILKLINCISNDSQLWCVYPLMYYGSCKEILEQKQEHGFGEISIQIISKQILRALSYLHSRNIIHRCICPENILVSANGNVCLTGFKFSVSLMDDGSLTRRLHEYPAEIHEYLNYLSPEILQQVNGLKILKFSFLIEYFYFNPRILTATIQSQTFTVSE